MRIFVGKPVTLTTTLALTDCLGLLEAKTYPVHKYWSSRELAGTISNNKLSASLRQTGCTSGFVEVNAGLSQLPNHTLIRCTFAVTTGMILIGGPAALAFIAGLGWKLWTAPPSNEWLSGQAFTWVMLVSVILMFASFIPSAFSERSRLILLLEDVLKADVVVGRYEGQPSPGSP